MNWADALLHSPSGDRAQGLDVLTRAYEYDHSGETHHERRGGYRSSVFASEKIRAGDLDGAIELARQDLDEQFATGEMIFRGFATSVLAEALLLVARAPTSMKRTRQLKRWPPSPQTPVSWCCTNCPIQRLRALFARMRGDERGFKVFCCPVPRQGRRGRLRGVSGTSRAMD